MTEETKKVDKEKKTYGTVNRISRKGKAEADTAFSQASRVWADLFRERLADFTAFDALFDIDYANKWRELCNQFINLPSDEEMRDLLNQATLDLFEAYKPVLDLADELEFFVGKAFPDEPRMVDEFGFKLLRSVSNQTNLKFTLYGFTLMTIYNDYATELLAVGLPATWFADYDNAIGNAGDKEINQERAKRMRIRATTKRVRHYNQLHDMWKPVYKASRVIYKNQPEVMKLWNW